MNISNLQPVTKYYNEFFNFYRMPAHLHSETEIMYVLEGICHTPCFDSEAGTWKDIALTSGSYIYIRGGVMHDLIVNRNCHCRILNIEYAADGSACKESPNWAVIKDDSSFLRILQVVHDKLGEWEKGYYPDKKTAEEDLQLSVMLLERKIKQQLSNPPVPLDHAGQYVGKAKLFIREHYTESIPVENIARQVGVAPAYLQRLFKQVTGNTILEFINDLRFERSKYLLTHSKLSLADVAENAGFGSRQRLAQVFRDKEHCSPGQYRALPRERS